MFSSFLAFVFSVWVAVSAVAPGFTPSEADMLTLDDLDVSGVTCGCTKHDFLVDGH